MDRLRWKADGLLCAWASGGHWCARLQLPRILRVLRRCDWRGPIEQDQVVDDNLDARPPLTRLRVLPAGGMQPAGNVDPAAFVGILRGHLGQLAPRGAARPLRLGLRLAVRVRPGVIGRTAERRGGRFHGPLYCTSGSWPSRPISCTEFRSFIAVPPRNLRLKTGKHICFPQGNKDKAGAEWRQGHGGQQPTRSSRPLRLRGPKPPYLRGASRSDTTLPQAVPIGCS